MAQGDIPVTVVGNLTGDPELRFTPNGAAVCNFSVASNPRVFDRQSGEWRDGDPVFMRCNVWRQQAENLAESLTRGQQVIVVGRLRQRSFTPRDSDREVTVIECEVDNVGPGLQWSVAKVSKAARGGGHRDGGQQRGGQYDDGEQWASQRQRGGGQQRQQREQYDDPWGAAPPAGSGDPYEDEAPF